MARRGTLRPDICGVCCRRFATGWWFGFGYFVAGLWWVGNALLVRAEEFAWALPLAVVALPALLAVYYGLAAAIARTVWTGDIGRIAALAFGFGVAEWLRAVTLTGFPWNAIGYAAMPVPLLMQSASVIGLYGMNAVAVFVFASPALLASPRRIGPGVLLAGLLVVAHAGYGLVRIQGTQAADGQLCPSGSCSRRFRSPKNGIEMCVTAFSGPCSTCPVPPNPIPRTGPR